MITFSRTRNSGRHWAKDKCQLQEGRFPPIYRLPSLRTRDHPQCYNWPKSPPVLNKINLQIKLKKKIWIWLYNTCTMMVTNARIKLMEEQTRRRIDILLLVIVALDERDDLIVSYWHDREGFILHLRSGDVAWFSQSRGSAVIAVRPDCFSHRGSIASEILTSILSATAVRYLCDLHFSQMTIQGIIVPTFINYSNRYFRILWFYQSYQNRCKSKSNIMLQTTEFYIQFSL